MKIDFEGVTRDLDLNHVSLGQAVTIQEFTGLPVLAWQQRLTGVNVIDYAGNKDALEGALADPAGTVKRSLMYTDPAWIKSVAAAHWLMLAQNGDDLPALDDEYPGDVLGFYMAFMTAVTAETEAVTARAQDKPGPTARPGRGTPRSRPASSREKPAARQEDARNLPSGPLPRITGS